MEESALDGAGAPPGRAAGFTDWLPGPAEVRRAVQDAVLATFGSWGYGQLATPLLEPLDTVAHGVSPEQQQSLFRFMDADGSLLALVGERTVSVARVVATQLRDAPRPLRLCYAGPVLRNQPLLGGRRREAVQAGCELIGDAGLAADAECIALAAESLRRAGLTGVQVDVGHADLLPGLLDDAGLDAGTRGAVLAALARRDLVAVEAALEGTGVGAAERDLLLRFPALRGDHELLDAAADQLRGDRALAALDQLRALWELLLAHGLAGTVHLDLGATQRDWDYYTGPTFELFSGDLGFPLGSGGRYDTLLGRFGATEPATGFVLHVDRCVDALSRGPVARERPSRCLRVAHAPGAEAAAITLSATLRRHVTETADEACRTRFVVDRHRPGAVTVVCDLAAQDMPPSGADVYVRAAAPPLWHLDGRWSEHPPATGVDRLRDRVLGAPSRSGVGP